MAPPASVAPIKDSSVLSQGAGLRDAAPFHGTQIDVGMRFAAFDFVTGDADFEESRESMSI
jgi:hypothetical protein